MKYLAGEPIPFPKKALQYSFYASVPESEKLIWEAGAMRWCQVPRRQFRIKSSYISVISISGQDISKGVRVFEIAIFSEMVLFCQGHAYSNAKGLCR